jgi:hypothetical protein
MYRQLWRIVDGAVFDALYTHSDYLTEKGKRAARLSVNKRVVGAILGFVEQSTKGRSGQPAADRVTVGNEPSSRTGLHFLVSKARAGCSRATRALARSASIFIRSGTWR